MTKALNLQPNLAQPDAFYESLIQLHEGLTDAQSGEVNARLVLILCNHIGDPAVIAEAFEVAARGMTRGPTEDLSVTS